MIEGNQHAVRVDAWLRAVPAELGVDALLGRFEKTFGDVWSRAQRTLGEVTLTAILDRAMVIASEVYPWVADLEVTPNGLRCRQLVGRQPELAQPEVAAAVGLVLAQFLTLLGSLTAEILTSALHAELSAVPERPQDRATADRPTKNKATNGSSAQAPKSGER